MLAQFLQEGIDISGYNGRLDGNDGRQWAEILFSDESRFNVSMYDGTDRVWRRNGEDSLSVSLNNVTDMVVAVS